VKLGKKAGRECVCVCEREREREKERERKRGRGRGDRRKWKGDQISLLVQPAEKAGRQTDRQQTGRRKRETKKNY
jgi:hypothetical protein